MSSSSTDVPAFTHESNPAIIAGVNYMLFGFMVDCILFGIAGGQTVHYYRAYPKDHQYIKIYVAFCMLLETAHFCSVAETLHFWMITCKMPENYPSSLIFRSTLLESFFVNDFLQFSIHAFYAFRVWHLSRRNISVTGLLMLLALMTYVSGTVLGSYQIIRRSTSTIHNHFSLINYSITLAGAAVTDTAISVASIYYLHTQRTGFTATENLIDKLIVCSANVGLVTSIGAIINLALLVAQPRSFSFLTWHLFLGNLYVNSTLITLNWRRNFRSTLNKRIAQSCYDDIDTHAIIAVDTESTPPLLTRLFDILRLLLSVGRWERNIALATTASCPGSNPTILTNLADVET